MLHYIDFHQLQIENKQYVAKIEERNDELLSVKLLTGKTIQVLNDYKKRLNEKLEEEAWLKGEVAAKRALLQKLDKEETRIEKEVWGEKRARNRLRQQIEEAQAMPNIQDYIMQKKEMYELETTLKNWQKKVEIMEMAAKKGGCHLEEAHWTDQSTGRRHVAALIVFLFFYTVKVLYK